MRRGLRPLFFFQFLPLPLHATEVVGKPIFGQQQFTQLLSEPGCCFFFAGSLTRCKQPKMRLLESMTYEMQISQLLCFDIHTKCRGCRGVFPFNIKAPPTREKESMAVRLLFAD